MSRRVRFAAAACLAVLVSVSGCSDGDSDTGRDGLGKLSPVVAGRKSDARLAYRHDLAIGVSADKVARHFAAARDRCLTETALRCVLLRSSASGIAGGTQRPFALIEVRLPHDSIAPFVAFVTTPLPDESPGDIAVEDQSTRAEDLTKPIGDAERRLAQLRDYRDRLNTLAARTDSRVEDLIKAANELSQVQTQIEEIEGERRTLEERVQTEILTVTFRSDGVRAGAFAPVGEAWERAGPTLGQSAASALRFTIASLPWLPIAAIALLLVRTLWRLRVKKRPGREESEPRT